VQHAVIAPIGNVNAAAAINPTPVGLFNVVALVPLDELVNDPFWPQTKVAVWLCAAATAINTPALISTREIDPISSPHLLLRKPDSRKSSDRHRAFTGV
jgi:hypothetical protein